MSRQHRATWFRLVLDTVQYGVGQMVLVSVFLAVVSLVLGGGAVGVKIGLFLVGTSYFGYATLSLWIGSRSGVLRQHGIIARIRGFRSDSDDQGADLGDVFPVVKSKHEDERLVAGTPVQRAIRSLPPASLYPVRAVDRPHKSARLFAASLTMYLTSIVMEVVFGVAATG